MSRFEFKLPDIGEGVTEGEVVAWLVHPGDRVVEDQPMVEVMTDKATVTIGCPRAGEVLETRGKPGEMIAVHSVLVVLDVGGDGAVGVAGLNGEARRDEGPAATAVGDIREHLPGMSSQTIPEADAPSGASARYFCDKPLATPATRKRARDLGVDLRVVPPTGEKGRVLTRDVESFRPQGAAHELATGDNRHVAFGKPAAPSPTTLESADVAEERIPFAGMRRKIALRMAESKRTAAHFTFVEECDVTLLKALRMRLLPAAEAQGAKLTYLPFIVKAVVAALKKHPMLNAALDEARQEIVYRKVFHIGIATSTDAGLLVPVIRHADRRTLLDLAREIDRLGQSAKMGKAQAKDLSGSTFTITSLGTQGGLFATPIINFPEVGILGVHKIKQRPVVKSGAITIGEVMLLSLSFDHRLVDGHVGAAFAYEIIAYLEDPDRLFLEMA